MIKTRIVTYEEFLEEPKRKYINGYDIETNVILQYREDGQKYEIVIRNYPWYFCIKLADLQNKRCVKILTRWLKSGYVKIKKEEEYVRIYVTNKNKKVMDHKHLLLVELIEIGIQTYEADVNSYQRCLVDNELEIESDYRILYFDIETDDRNPGIEIGRDRILSIAMVNNEGKTTYISGKNEKAILSRFLEKIEDYDVLCGWHSEGFDIPYLKERMHKNRIWFNWRKILQVDAMQKLMELNKKNAKLIKEVRGFSLDAVSRVFLGETKVEHDQGIYEMYEKNPELLKKYNIQDCQLVRRLDQKLNLLKQKIVEHQIAGCFLNEFAVTRILDVYVLRSAKKFGNIRFPSKPDRTGIDFSDSREANYEGGYVIDQVVGIHKNVYHFDFTSLYPSIIKTFNISPDTWQEDETDYCIKTPNKQCFSDCEGIIPKIITDILAARDHIRFIDMKKLKEGSPEWENAYYRQYAFKTIANSFYGMLGAKFSRYYKKEVAESITKSGRYLIKLVQSWFESKGYVVIYGDTDSVFVTSDHVLDQEQEHNEINAFLSYHLFKHFGVSNSFIDLKVENLYPKMFLGGKKKKYVKVVQDGKEQKLSIWGMECKRRETLTLAANAQTKLFEMLLIEDKNLVHVARWVQELKDKIVAGMTKDELTLQIRLSKPIEQYEKKIYDDLGNITEIKESKLAHVKVAKWLRENNIKEHGMNSWEKGCYVKYIVTNHKPKIEAVSVYQYEDKYDHAYYWNVKVYDILKRILVVAFPEHDWEQYVIEVPKPVRASRKKPGKGQRKLL